jgi:hypothetical protein
VNAHMIELEESQAKKPAAKKTIKRHSRPDP